MTRLSCSVIHCASNREGNCCRPDIKVTGSEACKCSETCCSSFIKAESNMSNAVDYSQPNPISNVLCNVSNCIHNQNSKCCADAINVRGIGACCKNDTECETFCCK